MTYDYKITLESVADGVTFIPTVPSYENYITFIPSSIVFTQFS